MDPKGDEYSSGNYLEDERSIWVEGFFDKARKSWTWWTEDDE